MHEGRSVDSFNAYEYIASNLDLLQAFGGDAEAGRIHYIQHGYSEGRQVASFDALAYLASNDDLIAAFGDNLTAAAEHYDTSGYTEHRPTNSFDALEYIASNSDLINAFGTDTAAGEWHYVQHGYDEGRSTTSFSAEQYLANYSDLQAAFGDDPTAAETHYIEHGYYEDRVDTAVSGASPIGTFTGSAGDNTMVVGSGDIMTGNGGDDHFVFNEVLSSPATITDFNLGDLLVINASAFDHGMTAGGTAPVSDVADHTSATTAGTDGAFLYDTTDHTLYWDPTGGDTSDAMALVHLGSVASLADTDFQLA